jgi:hypothetical protein
VTALIVDTGDRVMVLVFLWAYSQHIIKTAVTSTPWFTLSMAPDWGRKTELNVDIVVEVTVAAMESCFDEGIVVSVRAHLGSVLVGRDTHVQLWAVVRQRRDPEILARCDCSRGKLEVFVGAVFPTVFFWPVDTDVMDHVIPVEDPEAQWVCCILCWLFVDLPFGLHFFEGGIGVVGRWRLRLGLAVFSSITAISVRADKVVSFGFMHQAGLDSLRAATTIHAVGITQRIIELGTTSTVTAWSSTRGRRYSSELTDGRTSCGCRCLDGLHDDLLNWDGKRSVNLKRRL